MEILGTIPPREVRDDDVCVDLAELRRLGLEGQYKQCAVGHKDERDDYPLYLVGDGVLTLNFPGQPIVMLDRNETARLYIFLQAPHVQSLMLAVLRAHLLERGGAVAELVRWIDQQPAA